MEVLQLQTPACPITYTVGSAPSAIWCDRVLMRCGPAFGLHGEPRAGAAQNRVLLDGLSMSGLKASREPDGLLHLQLRQDSSPLVGGPSGSRRRSGWGRAGRGEELHRSVGTNMPFECPVIGH